MILQRDYFDRFAAAFVRGKLADTALQNAGLSLFTRPREDLSESERFALIQIGEERGLRLHKFKRTINDLLQKGEGLRESGLVT
jgi:hypothetical protein